MTDAPSPPVDHELALSSARVGTRESKLARIQTAIVTERLQQLFPKLALEIVPIKSGGDKVLDRPIVQLAGQGVFVKELEEALLAGRVDLLVHSLKDLPTTLPEGLVLACVLDRADARDVLVSRNNRSLADLPKAASIATSSRRRAAQLKAARPDLQFHDIRGNIQTRLRKFDESDLDGMILAAAGLIRLGLTERISQYLEVEISTPAVGQGALAVECRAEDKRVLSLLEGLSDRKVAAQAACERAFLDKLGGGCSIPAGALAQLKADGRLELTACVAAIDGSKIIRATLDDKQENAVRLGHNMVEHVVSLGAEEILAPLKESLPAKISPP